MIDSNDFGGDCKRLVRDWENLFFPPSIPEGQPARICFVNKNSEADARSLSEAEVEACFPRINGLTDRSAQIGSLRKEYPDWWAQREKESPDQVIYALPEHVLLTTQTLFKFSDADAQAEREFARICQAVRAIGYCGQLFIDGVTTPGDASRIADDFKLLEQQIRRTTEVSLSEDEMRGLKRTLFEDWRDRQLGASGLLLCNVQFQMERLALRQQWLALPLNVRPWLPDFRLRPSMSLGNRQVAVFLEKVREFKDRWHISSIATWDYVVARGPRMPDYRSEEAANYFPPFFHMRRTEMTSRREFNTHQQQTPADLVKERRQSDSYRRLFITHFWNHVLEQRYRPISGKRAHGFVAQKLATIAALIDEDASVDRVKKDLKIIRWLQTGKQRGLGRS